MTSAGAVGAEAQYPVWDRVVRTIHWYFPLAIGTMWWSGEQGRMDIHEWVVQHDCGGTDPHRLGIHWQ